MTEQGERIRVGVVGVGYLGRYHAEKFSAMPHVDLAGVVDVDGSQAERVAKTCRTRAFESYESLLGQVDAVSIVTPTPAHFAVGKAFLEHGVDVMIEKPITTALDQAEELIRIADSRGLIIQVGHLERFNPAFVAARPLIRSPLLIEAFRKNTYKTRGTDVSVVLDLMIHDIDLVLSLVGAEVCDVRAAGVTCVSEHTDVAAARIEFADGSVASLTSSRMSSRNEREMHCYQADGHIAVDFGGHAVTVIRKGDGSGNGPDDVIDVRTRQLEKGDALMEELAAFVEAVKTRREPVVSGGMGRDALKTALAVMAEIDRAGR